MQKKLTKENILESLFYGIKENNIEPISISKSNIERIITQYKNNRLFLGNYVKGELDTFKEASCLLLAINKVGVTRDKIDNASIAFDTALKICEKPYWHFGKYANDAKNLKEISFKKSFEKDITTLTTVKENIVLSLVHNNSDYFAIAQNLELLYIKALQNNNYQKVKLPLENTSSNS